MSIATYDDFINYLDADEAKDLSHLNLPTDPDIAKQRIEYMLEQAEQQWFSWFGLDPNSASIPIECSGNAVVCEIVIARFNLDYNQARDDVKERFAFCREISRDYIKDQLAKAKLPDGGTGVLPDADDGFMSIFTI